MLIKSADNKTPHIEALTALLDRPDVDATLRRRIEHEIKICRAGVRGESEAAYEIDFHYKEREGWAVLHDLRIEVSGRVAQIDHLLLNRLLDCYVLETKSFSEGLGVNEHGEFVRFFGGRPTGMPSPIEQNHKHISVLEALFASSSPPGKGCRPLEAWGWLLLAAVSLDDSTVVADAMGRPCQGQPKKPWGSGRRR